MLRAEARWFAAALARHDTSRLSPLLSIGSGDARFRSTRQPWVDELVFDPLTRRGIQVLHHELEWRDGIDIAGDLTDPAFIDELRALGVAAIICNSVLEHLDDRAPLLRGLAHALPPGGLLFISVPHRFPFHPDPIDTMYRPTPEELASSLEGFTVLDSEAVATESLARYWIGSRSKVESIRNGVKAVAGRRSAPAPGPAAATATPAPASATNWRSTLRMAAVDTTVSCVVAERAGAHGTASP